MQQYLPANREILMALLQTTRKIPDVDGAPPNKNGLIWKAAYEAPSMCPERLPEEHQTNVPFVRRAGSWARRAEHTTQRSGRARSGYFLLPDVVANVSPDKEGRANLGSKPNLLVKPAFNA